MSQDVQEIVKKNVTECIGLFYDLGLEKDNAKVQYLNSLKNPDSQAQKDIALLVSILKFSKNFNDNLFLTKALKINLKSESESNSTDLETILKECKSELEQISLKNAHFLKEVGFTLKHLALALVMVGAPTLVASLVFHASLGATLGIALMCLLYCLIKVIDNYKIMTQQMQDNKKDYDTINQDDRYNALKI